jgi:hypothetical protein
VWNAPLEFGGVLVGEEVAISIDVQFIKDRGCWLAETGPTSPPDFVCVGKESGKLEQ